MSTAPRVGGTSDFALADRLRTRLEEFVTVGPLKNAFEEQRKLYFSEFEESTDPDWEGVIDYFLFDWFDEKGEGLVDHFLAAHPDLAQAEREILLEWQDSLNSAFHIRSVSKDCLRLRDLDSGYDLDVTLTKPNSHELFKKGQYVVARLLPLGDHIILSGLQFIIPDRKTALAWLELRSKVNELHSPEEIEKAVRESCQAFCELFGCDELTVPSSNLLPTLRRFQEYLLKERQHPELGTTAAERYRAEIGRELETPDLQAPLDLFAEAQDVTILCDDFDGIVVLPDFSRFKHVFATDDPEKAVPEWRELVWTYIKSPDIPTVAFERVAEKQPKRVEKVLRAALGDNNFSLEHMYAALLHYKQPVEGLDDLEDERQLWDLFDGNAQTAKPDAKQRKRQTKAAGLKQGPASTKLAARMGLRASKNAPQKAARKKKSMGATAAKSASRTPKLTARASKAVRKSAPRRKG